MSDTGLADAPRKAPWRGRKRVADPRTEVVHTRWKPAERAALKAAAAQAGLSEGAYLRALALGNPGIRARRQPLADRQELARTLGLLGNYTSNLNQLARVANTSGKLPTEEALDNLARQVRELRGSLMKALDREDDARGD